MASSQPVFFYDPVYTDGLSPEARFPRDRYRKVRAELEARRFEATARIVPSPLCAVEDLRTVHTSEYIEAFFQRRLDERAARRIGLRPWTDRIAERTLKILGGTVAATHALLRHGASIAGNLAGGTHHAFADFGAGYCVFNDIAVAAEVARRDYGVNRVLVIDLDVHQGDGTAKIFEDDPEVFTLSVHCAENFPFRKQRSDLDVALPAGTDDDDYLRALDDALSATVAQFAPQLLIYQAGVDPLAEDQLGRLELSRAGLRNRNARVFDLARINDVPTLVLMGGGYARPLDRSVEAFADLFEQAVASRPFADEVC